MAISTKFSSVRLPQGSQLDLIDISTPVEISAVEKKFSETYMNRAFFRTLTHYLISKTRRDIQETLTPFFVPKWTFDRLKVLSAVGCKEKRGNPPKKQKILPFQLKKRLQESQLLRLNRQIKTLRDQDDLP